MKKKPGEELGMPTQRQASRVARMIGCEGSHQTEDGVWMPCSTHEKLTSIIGSSSKSADPVKKKRKRKGRNRVTGWEQLREGGIAGIDTLADGSLVSAEFAAKSARKARRDRLAATPALSAERIRGSKRNAIGSASSVSKATKVEIDPATLKTLLQKVKDHNKSVQDKETWRKASLGQLKAVYRRGAGAFSVSHRPGMTRNQWAMGRVNAFLKILSSGKPNNSRYVGDNDLLPKNHPWRKTIGTKSLETKRFRRGLGASFDPDAVDADGDGEIQDGTRFARPALGRRMIQAARTVLTSKPFGKTRKRKAYERLDLGSLMKRAADPDGGFTIKMGPNTDAKSGWAIARNGKGIAIPASTLFNKDGGVSDEGMRLVWAYFDRHKDLFLGDDDPDSGISVHLGAWHNPETGMIHLDVSDVHSKDKFSKEQAVAIGSKEKQISIADIDEIQAALGDGDWGAHETTIVTGGDGGDIIDLADLEPELQKLDKIYGKIDRRSLRERVEEGPEGVAMLLAEPIKELKDKHKVQKDWHGIVSLKPEKRQEIADFYNAAPEIEAEQASEEIREAYKALTDEIDRQYEMLVNELGIKVEFVDFDPYADFMEMRKDYLENRRLKIMKTEVTGSHPLMTDEQNDKLRAIHDAFGHLATGRGFDRHGEEAAYQAHSTMFSEEAKKALATELRAQNSALIVNGDFAPQKLLLLPDTMIKSLFVMASLMFKAFKDLSKKARIDSDLDNAYSSTSSHHVSCGRVPSSAKPQK